MPAPPTLPVLSKRLVDKMVVEDYTNFNELIPFCDPGAEEDHAFLDCPKRVKKELGMK